MQKIKFYIQPTVEIYPAELSTTILGTSEERPTGYAIDNTEASDDNVISITEQGGSLWEDGFVEID